jgi:hypothetical protein
MRNPFRPPVLSPAEAAEKSAQTEQLLFGRGFPIAGAIGLALTIVLNVVAIQHWQMASAAYFAKGWWANWFPNYVIWTLLLGTGLAYLKSRKAPAAGAR